MSDRSPEIEARIGELETERIEREIEKLEEELKVLRRPYFRRPAAIASVLTSLLGIAVLAQQMVAARYDAFQARQELANVQSERVEARDELAELQTRYDDRSAQMDALQARFGATKASLEGVQHRIDALTTDLSQSIEAKAIAESEVHVLSSRRDSLESDLEHQRERAGRELADVRDAASKENHRYTQELVKLSLVKDEVERQAEARKAIEKEMEEKREELARLQEQLDALEQENEAQRQEFDMQRDAFEVQRTALTAQLERKRRDLEMRERDLAAAIEADRKKREELVKVREELAEVKRVPRGALVAQVSPLDKMSQAELESEYRRIQRERSLPRSGRQLEIGHDSQRLVEVMSRMKQVPLDDQ